MQGWQRVYQDVVFGSGGEAKGVEGSDAAEDFDGADGDELVGVVGTEELQDVSPGDD